jgi:hypothetical protein
MNANDKQHLLTLPSALFNSLSPLFNVSDLGSRIGLSSCGGNVDTILTQEMQLMVARR